MIRRFSLVLAQLSCMSMAAILCAGIAMAQPKNMPGAPKVVGDGAKQTLLDYSSKRAPSLFEMTHLHL